MSITRPPIIEFVVDNEVIKVFLFNVCNKYIKDTLVIKKILRNYLYPPPPNFVYKLFFFFSLL